MIVALKDVNKSYQRGDETIVALNNLNLEVSKGDFLSIMGPKQSGKSSLLNLIGGLDTPTSGSIKVDGDVGFLFQFYNLLPTLSVFRNVQIPLLLSKLSNSQRKEHVERVLNIVNLLDESEQQVSQLSLEQQQRTSLHEHWLLTHRFWFVMNQLLTSIKTWQLKFYNYCTH